MTWLKTVTKFDWIFLLKNIHNQYHKRLIVKNLKCITKAQHGLLTYLLGSEHHIHVVYMFFFCLFPFVYFLHCIVWIEIIVSEFGFKVQNCTTAPVSHSKSLDLHAWPDTIAYLPILLGKYPQVFILPQSGHLFYLLVCSFYVNPMCDSKMIRDYTVNFSNFQLP